MSQQDLLIEIGTEELPPKALKKLSDAFTNGIIDGLKEADLGHGEVTAYCTPRRMAVLVRGLAAAQADKAVERRGPAVQAAFDEDGNPTKATEGFARSCGASVDELEKLETDKGAWLVFRTTQQGQPTAELVPAIVEASLNKLPIPKRMRWGDLDAEFVRPVHWLVLLFGDEVIEAEILSVKSGRESRGHRFHHPEPIYIAEPATYAPMLESEGRVMADYGARREAIRGLVMEAAEKAGGRAVIDEALLDEVTGLVEWPVPVVGNFEERFLAVPAECLISAMKEHQKYFHMVDADGALMPNFITLSNIDSSDITKVREGNERVIRPRLTDAEFFWKQDLKKPLAARRDSLATVVFQKDLGTLLEKSERVEQLAVELAGLLGVDTAQAAQAAQLAKCDLMSEMVFEFPELQGIMGRYYAQHEGLAEAVAAAMDEQYMPRGAGDELPASGVGRVLALAERLDTLLGIFAIGQKPTGAKDPFGLRRAALGVLRIIIEPGLDLDLRALLESAAKQLESKLGDKAQAAVEECFDYILDRLKAYYADRGIAADTIDSVLALKPTNPLDFDRRVRAVQAFRELPEAEALAAANKRIGNILKKAECAVGDGIDAALLQDEAEKALASQVEASAAEVAPLFEARDYTEALKRLAALRAPVDTFFDEVMVMAEDATLRDNRLALLKRMSGLFLQVADLSRLQS